MADTRNDDIARRLATIIADGHAYDRHVMGSRGRGERADRDHERFPYMTREEFKEHIYNALKDPKLQGYKHNDGSVTFILPGKGAERGIKLEVDFSPSGTHGRYDSMTAFLRDRGRLETDISVARERSQTSPSRQPYASSNALNQFASDIRGRLDTYEAERNKDRVQNPRRPLTDAELAAGQGDVDAYRRQQQQESRAQQPSSPPKPDSEKPTASAGDRPTISLRRAAAGGAVGAALTALGTAAQAQEAARADGRSSATASDYGRAAWDQTPMGAAGRGRYAEAFMRAFEIVDPTLGVASGGMRGAFRGAGADVDPGMMAGIRALSGDQRRQLDRNVREIGFVNREQFFTLQKSGLTELRDSEGKRVDVGRILRDPRQRESFMGSLERSMDNIKDPAEKDKVRQMIDSCHEFLGLEPRREAILASTERIVGRTEAPIAATPQPAQQQENRPQAPRA